MAIFLSSIPPASRKLHSEGLSLVQANAPGATSLRLGLLNLMPDKATTERQWLRLLAASDINAHVSLLRLHGWVPRSTSADYMNQYYQGWRDLNDLDALIITGAPLGQFALHEVGYWSEFTQLLDHYAHTSTPLLLSCWAAHAALHHFHQLSTHRRKHKLSGLFSHHTTVDALTHGLPHKVHLPHSRFAQLNSNMLATSNALQVLIHSDITGPALLRDTTAPRCYLLGHPEYEADTLALEYEHDKKKGLSVAMPEHYFVDDDPSKLPEPTWQLQGSQLLRNWLRPLQAPARRQR